MAYIGRQPTVGNFRICDAISVVNGQAAYTMQVGGVNVIPESANNMIVSLNGVIQKPGSSYTVSSSTITFSSNLSTGDVIDFIQILGGVANIGTPTDGTVTAAKLVDGAVSNAKLANSSITLNSSAVSLGGSHSIVNTPAWSVSISANQTLSNGVYTKVAFDREEVDTNNAFDNSTNYRFTVPSGGAGKYFIAASLRTTTSNDFDSFYLNIKKNGSDYVFASIRNEFRETMTTSCLIDLADADYLECFAYNGEGSSIDLSGSSDKPSGTHFSGYRILS
jgi:hypothetical protein